MAEHCPSCETSVDTTQGRWCGSCGARLAVPRATAEPTENEGGLLAPSSLGLLTSSAEHEPLDVEDEVAARLAPRRHRRRVLVAGATAVALLATASVVTGDQDDPSEPGSRVAVAGGSPAGTGVVSGLAFDALPTQTVWTSQVEPGSWRTEVTVGASVVLEQALGGPLVGRDPQTGEILWIRHQPGDGGNRIVGDTVLTDGRALDAETGHVRWTRTGRGWPSPLDDETVLYAEDRMVEAVSLATGETRWSAPTNSDSEPLHIETVLPGPDIIRVVATPFGSAATGTDDDQPRYLLAFDKTTGEQRWTRRIDAGPGTDRYAGVKANGAFSVHAADGHYIVLGEDGEPVGVPIPVASTGESDMVPGAAVATDPDDPSRWLLAVPTGTELDTLTVFDNRGEPRWYWESPSSEDGFAILGAEDGRFELQTTTMVTSRPTANIELREMLRDQLVRLDVATGEEAPSIAPEGISPWLRDVRSHPVPATVDLSDRHLRVRLHDEDVSWTQPFSHEAGGAVTTSGGRVFIPTVTGTRVLSSEDGSVIVELASGQEPGPQGLGRPRLAAPVAMDGVMAVGSSEETPSLTAFDIPSFTTRWEARLPPSGRLGGALTSDGTEVFYTLERELHGYDLDSGKRTLRLRTHGTLTDLAVTPTHVVGTVSRRHWLEVQERRREVVAVDRATGEIAWDHASQEVCTAPAILEDRSAVVVGHMDGLRWYDLTTGKTTWHRHDLGPICRPVAVAAGLVIASPTEDLGPGVMQDPVGRHVRALDPEDGETVWRTGFDAPVAVAPVVAGDQVLVALVDGSILALDATDGTITSRTSVEGVPASPPVVAEGGTLIVMTTDGVVTALR